MNSFIFCAPSGYTEATHSLIHNHIHSINAQTLQCLHKHFLGNKKITSCTEICLCQRIQLNVANLMVFFNHIKTAFKKVYQGCWSLCFYKMGCRQKKRLGTCAIGISYVFAFSQPLSSVYLQDSRFLCVLFLCEVTGKQIYWFSECQQQEHS